MAQKTTDITKQGPQSYRDLQKANAEAFQTASATSSFANLKPSYSYAPSTAFIYEGGEQSPVQQSGGDYWGNSMFDAASANEEDYQNNLLDLRAENQPWYAQLGAGLAKAVTTAGTTFLDGTVGLIAGVGTAIGEQRWSGLWDNEVSNGLAELNRELENVLPNYRTSEEQERPWYENLGTVNFWADSVIKNLGFTVGAYYSGGAWNKALKAVGWLKSAMGAKVIGSAVSAVNEGRIEANNNAHDFLQLQNQQISDAINQRRNEILASEVSDEEKEVALFNLESQAQELRQDAKDRADDMGLITFIGNTILLSLDNYAQFGRLYARGFKHSKGLASNLTKAAEELAVEEAGRNVVKQGAKYAWKDITKKEALMRGLKNGLLEGNEELAQAFIADAAGNMRTYDSPDAYYKALKDPKAQLQTKDFLTSVTEGFANTYGNGDRWEEFAVGAFTGLLGMPTFGKVNNSDANTYIGRGKMIGLSNGLFGEIRNANAQNREGRAAVESMNKYLDKLQTRSRYFAQSQSFTNAMDGWAEEGDAFEYKNAEDNDDFTAISRFAQTGKLNDLKDLVKQDFENISDEELTKIAMATSPNMEMGEDNSVVTSNEDGSPKAGGWRNTDGSLMSDTEEGRQQMRESLSKKRDKILSEIDKYEKSVEAVRALGNNSLTEDQVNELAWLNWKVGMFTDRYNSIKSENQEFLSNLQKGLQAFENTKGEIIDEESEEGQKLLTAMENTSKFINALQQAESPLQLAALMEANPHLTEFLEEIGYSMIEDATGIDAATFDKSMEDLKDTVRIAKAAKSFNERYKEFAEDPIKLIQNREKIDKKQEKVDTATKEVNLRDKVNSSNTSDIVKGIEEGDLNVDELDGLFSQEDTEFLNNVGKEDEPESSPTPQTGKQKVEEAKKIINTTQRMEDALDELADNGIDNQAIEDAKTLLQQSKEVSESEEELLNTASQAFNDPTLLYNEDDPSMQEVSQEELESVLDDRIAQAKSVIEMAKASLAGQEEELKDLPSTEVVTARRGGELLNNTPKEEPESTTPSANPTDNATSPAATTPQQPLPQSEEVPQPEPIPEETGHDATATIITENEKQKIDQEKAAKEEEATKAKEQVDDLFTPVKETLPAGTEEAFNGALSEILHAIDTLVNAGATDSEIGSAVKSTQSYKTAKQLAPTIDSYLDAYLTSRRAKKQAPQTESPTESSQTKESKISTPVIAEDEVRRQTTAQMNEDPNKGQLTGSYQYWKPTISYMPFGKAYEKGNTTPFHKLARQLGYKGQQLRRIEAVGEYLEDHGAFKLIDSGAVKVGDEVHFMIDSALNDKAGEVVILMTDSQGRVIGDVMSPEDSTFDRQLGLRAFVDRVIKEWQDAGSPQTFTSKEVSSVDKNMVGKVPYLADHETMNSLNDIFDDQGKPIPFKIGVALNSGPNERIIMTPGRTKKQGLSAEDKTINPALRAKAGQPFLLLPTSSAINHYMPVPIVMPLYSSDTQNSALGQEIHKVLEKVATSTNDNVIKVIEALEELLAVKEIHINYDGDQVRVTIKHHGDAHQRTIYRGSKTAPNLVEQLEMGLQGLPFQVSRKYINTTYAGKDYNRMIGELARVNLPPGATHTVSDWFTIKPLTSTGQQAKTRSPRTTRTNPHAVSNEVVIDWGGKQLFVDPQSWEVSDGTTSYRGVRADRAAAYAFGIYTKQDMTKPYRSPKGYYDPVKRDFIEEPNVAPQATQPTAQPTTPIRKTITYTPKGKETQTYTIEGTHIYNQDGKEVFKEDSIDRNKIYANLAVQEGRAKVVEYRGHKYVVNNRGDIISVTSGKKMKWGPENGNRKAILQLAGVNEAASQPSQATQEESQEEPNNEPNNEPQVQSGPLAQIVERNFGGYFEGGGAIIENDYPQLPAHLITKLENYIMGGLIGEGNYPPLTEDEAREFLEKSNPALLPQEQTSTPTSPEDKARKAGLLGNKVREALWEALTPEQQTLIADKKGPKQKQWMAALEGAFDITSNTFDTDKLKGTVDEFLGRKGLYRRAQRPQRTWDRKKETGWMKKALPQLSDDEHLRIVEGVEKLAIPDGGFAYGKFQEGIITLAGNTARGTLYHEAFHAVAHTLLTEQEFKSLFSAAQKKWGNIGELELEENLAEDFRRYMQLEETPVLGALVKVYRFLKHLVQNLLGKEPYLNGLYYRISRGKLANRQVGQSEATRYSAISDLEEAEYNIQEKKAELEDLNNQWSKVAKTRLNKWFTAYEGNNHIKYRYYSDTGYLSTGDAEEAIPQELKDVLIAREDRGRGYILIDKKENVDKKKEALKREIESLEGQLDKLRSRAAKEEMAKASEELLQNDEVYYRRVEQYHRDKLMYDNLSEENKQYLFEKGITPEEFSEMTKLEKEVLFQCKY